MKKLLSIWAIGTLLWLIPAVAISQTIGKDPKSIVVPPKAKMTPIIPKAGNLLVIDASTAIGNVKFKHDFPDGAWAVDGKKFTVAIPAATKETKTWTIYVTYWKEEADETIPIRITGTDGPQPLDPTATPVEKLSAKLDAFIKLQTKTNKDLADAIAGNVPPVSKVAAHVSFVGAESGAALTVNNDAALRKFFSTANIKVHVVLHSDPILSQDKWAAALKSAGGAPCVVFQDAEGHIIGNGPMTSSQQVMDLAAQYIRR